MQINTKRSKATTNTCRTITKRHINGEKRQSVAREYRQFTQGKTKTSTWQQKHANHHDDIQNNYHRDVKWLLIDRGFL